MVFALAEPRRPMPALCPGSTFLAAGSMLSGHRFPPHAFCPVVPFIPLCIAGMGTRLRIVRKSGWLMHVDNVISCENQHGL